MNGESPNELVHPTRNHMIELPDIAAEYLSNKKTIAELEDKNEVLRQQLSDRLNAHTVTQPTVWEMGGAKVTWVKGSERKTLVRGRLVRLGITTDVLEKATVVTTGKSTIRVEANDAKSSGSSVDEAGKEEGAV